MAERFEIAGRITASDEASVVLERVSRNMQALAARTRNEFAVATRETTQTVRAMTTGLLNELNPALAQSIDRLSSAAREARSLPGAMGAATVALAGVSLALAEVVRRQDQQIDATIRMSRAVRAMDLSALRSQVAGVTEQIERLQALMSGDLLAKLRGLFAQAFGQNLPELHEQLTKLRDAFEQVFPKVAEQEVQQILLQRFETQRKLLEVQREQAAERGDLEAVKRLNADIVAVLESRIRAEEAVIARTIEARKAAELAVAPFSVIREELDRIGRVQKAVAAEAGRAAVSTEQIQQAKLLSDLEIQRLQTLRQIVALGGTAVEVLKTQGSELDQIIITYTQQGLPVIDAALVAEVKKRDALRGQLLELQLQIEAHQRLAKTIDLEAKALDEQLERLKIGASITDQERIRLEQIETRRRSELQQIREGDPLADAQRQLVELRAMREREQVEFERRVRLDPTAGLTLGLDRMIEEFGAAGRRMESLAERTASTMASSFSDQFFAVVTGDFKKLPELGRQFMAQMVRNITDELARLVTAPILARVRAFVGSAFGGAGPVPFGPSLLAAALPVDVTRAAPQVIADLQARGYTILGTAAGGQVAVPPTTFQAGMLPPVGFGNLSGYLNYPIIFAPGASSAVVVSGGQVIQSGSELALAGISTPGVYGQSAYTLTGAQLLGAAGGIAGVGLGIYSATQGDVIGGAVSTGVGAYTAITALGGTAALGVVGGIIGVGLAIGLGMQAQSAARRRRRGLQRRIQTAQDAARQMSTAINAAQTTEQLLSARITVFLTERSVSLGGLMLAMALEVEGGRFPPIPPGGASRAIVEMLSGRIAPEGWPGLSRSESGLPYGIVTTNELLQALGSTAAELMAAFAEKYATFSDQEELALVAYEEREPTGQVRIRTYLPLRAFEQVPAGTQEAFFSTSLLRSQGLSDAMIDFIARRLRSRNIRRDILTDLSTTAFLDTDL